MTTKIKYDECYLDEDAGLSLEQLNDKAFEGMFAHFIMNGYVFATMIPKTFIYEKSFTGKEEYELAGYPDELLDLELNSV